MIKNELLLANLLVYFLKFPTITSPIFFAASCIGLRGRLNARQEKVIERMFTEGPDAFKGGLSAENYFKITSTSRATATRDLQDLVDKSALTKTGELKRTRYWLNICFDR